MRVRVLVLVAATLCLSAHDFWIEPSAFRPQANGPLALRLRVGQRFKGDPVPRLEALVERFTIWGPDGEKPVIGREGMDPAGVLRTGAPGLLVASYFSKPSSVELEGPKFEAYLQEEGLDGISKLRAKRGETGKPAKDAFIRCAKSVIDVGGQGGAGFDHAFGLPLELIPSRNPCASGADLPVDLRYEGKGLKGALVVAIRQDAPDQKVSARTDARGHVSLALGKGVWLVKAVHMISEGDQWKSYWASLTFERM